MPSGARGTSHGSGELALCQKGSVSNPAAAQVSIHVARFRAWSVFFLPASMIFDIRKLPSHTVSSCKVKTETE